MYEYIVFDLDGTLIDSIQQIAAAVNHALKTCGFPEVPNYRDLSWFVGPPLRDGFEKLVGTRDDSLVDRLVAAYRDVYREISGEAKPYPGIPPLLANLYRMNRTLAVATTKPTVFARQILKRLELDRLFGTIVGSELDGTRSAKEQLIRCVTEAYNAPRADFVHVGDRRDDIIGAKRNGIDSVAVLYGYGTSVELKESKPTFVASDVKELRRILTLPTQ